MMWLKYRIAYAGNQSQAVVSGEEDGEMIVGLISKENCPLEPPFVFNHSTSMSHANPQTESYQRPAGSRSSEKLVLHLPMREAVTLAY